MAEAWQNQQCARADWDKPCSVFVWVLELEKLQQRRVFVVLICVTVAGFLLQPQPLPKLWQQTKPRCTVVVAQNPSSCLASQSPPLILLDTKQRFTPLPAKLNICYFFKNLPWKTYDCLSAKSLSTSWVLFPFNIANSSMSVGTYILHLSPSTCWACKLVDRLRGIRIK